MLPEMKANDMSDKKVTSMTQTRTNLSKTRFAAGYNGMWPIHTTVKQRQW